MKALSIKEPWASLIVNGYKEYEFRSWKMSYRGKVLIHASKTIEKEEKQKFDEYNLEYSKGEIIGCATITDCILVDSNFDKILRNKNSKVYGNIHTNLYAWKLENIEKYDHKIKATGKLGLWNYNEE